MEKDLKFFELAESGESFCRFYLWDGPYVSLGRFQNRDRDLLPSCTIPVVVRPTGGYAVLHGHDLTLSLAFPLELFFQRKIQKSNRLRSVKGIYRWLVGPLVQALNQVGIDASFGEDLLAIPMASKSTDCFAHISSNDIIERTNGRKICGVALRLNRKAVLAQVSIPIAEPLVRPDIVFQVPAQYEKLSLDPSSFYNIVRKYYKNLEESKSF